MRDAMKGLGLAAAVATGCGDTTEISFAPLHRPDASAQVSDKVAEPNKKPVANTTAECVRAIRHALGDSAIKSQRPHDKYRESVMLRADANTANLNVDGGLCDPICEVEVKPNGDGVGTAHSQPRVDLHCPPK